MEDRVGRGRTGSPVHGTMRTPGPGESAEDPRKKSAQRSSEVRKTSYLAVLTGVAVYTLVNARCR